MSGYHQWTYLNTALSTRRRGQRMGRNAMGDTHVSPPDSIKLENNTYARYGEPDERGERTIIVTHFTTDLLKLYKPAPAYEGDPIGEVFDEGWPDVEVLSANTTATSLKRFRDYGSIYPYSVKGDLFVKVGRSDNILLPFVDGMWAHGWKVFPYVARMGLFSRLGDNDATADLATYFDVRGWGAMAESIFRVANWIPRYFAGSNLMYGRKEPDGYAVPRVGVAKRRWGGRYKDIREQLQTTGLHYDSTDLDPSVNYGTGLPARDIWRGTGTVFPTREQVLALVK